MITLHFFYNYEKPICEKFQIIPIRFKKNLCQRVKDLKVKQQRKKKKKERGKYRSYSLSLKICALKWIEEGIDDRIISNKLDIPLKNIRRWKKQGPFRKQGCGRKSIDLEMEQKLAQWCHETIRNTNKRVSRAMIQTQALKMIKQGVDFKASKGWTDKFVRKYKLIRNKRISKL
ncbi:unnamed protein product [Paramecium pentaurelia]|uniref:HTH CENPB-type domain-containing protein n=1 Tax=Paramecium pentaurelia TaxID=43138 RepID=A0A8S1XJQ4_9CILI|nr:unnamed protein product [Paramecium pentaurelia]